MSVISNTTVLSNFAEINALSMLHQLYPELFLPTEVFQEIRDGLDEGYAFYSELAQLLDPRSASGWLHLTGLAQDEEIELFAKMPTRLHQGEAACLAIAQYRNWVLLTDDRSARRYAMTQGIRLSGTLGCLALGVKRQHWTLAEGNRRLGEMIEVGFFSPLSDLQELMS